MTNAKLVANKARVKRYRAIHRRIDYTPASDVLPIIQHHLRIGTDPCLVGVIDYLSDLGNGPLPGKGVNRGKTQRFPSTSTLPTVPKAT